MPIKLKKSENPTDILCDFIIDLANRIENISKTDPQAKIKLINDILSLPDHFDDLNVSTSILEFNPHGQTIDSVTDIARCKDKSIANAVAKSFFKLILKYFGEKDSLYWFLRSRPSGGPCLLNTCYMDTYMFVKNKIFIIIRNTFVGGCNRNWKCSEFDSGQLNYVLYVTKDMLNDESSKIRNAWKRCIKHVHDLTHETRFSKNLDDVDAARNYAESSYLISQTYSKSNQYLALLEMSITRSSILSVAQKDYWERSDFDEKEYSRIMLFKLEWCEVLLQHAILEESRGDFKSAGDRRKRVVDMASTINPLVDSGIYAYSYSNLLVKLFFLSLRPVDILIKFDLKKLKKNREGLVSIWPRSAEGWKLLDESFLVCRDIMYLKYDKIATRDFIDWLNGTYAESILESSNDAWFEDSFLRILRSKIIAILRETAINFDDEFIWSELLFMLIQEINFWHDEDGFYDEDVLIKAFSTANEIVNIFERLLAKTGNELYEEKAKDYRRISNEIRDEFNSVGSKRFSSIQWYGKDPEGMLIV